MLDKQEGFDNLAVMPALHQPLTVREFFLIRTVFSNNTRMRFSTSLNIKGLEMLKRDAEMFPSTITEEGSKWAEMRET